jgi:hypothetical protein
VSVMGEHEIYQILTSITRVQDHCARLARAARARPIRARTLRHLGVADGPKETLVGGVCDDLGLRMWWMAI